MLKCKLVRKYFLFIAALIMMKSRRRRWEEHVARMGKKDTFIQGISGRG
jgi:hypothetical protein